MKSPRCFAALIATFVFFSASSSIAQQFVRLTPDSNYACIKYPSGKFGVGKASATGYAPRSFGVASKEISERLSTKRVAARSKTRIMNEFLKDNEISNVQFQNIVDTQGAFGVPQPQVAKILKFLSAINKLNSEISLLSNELSALRDCQKGKTDFRAIFTAKSPAILAQNSTQIVLASILEVAFPGSYDNSFKAFFCIQKEGDSQFRLAAGHKNPCSESSLGGVFPSCLAPANKLLMPLALSYLASNASPSLIQSAQDSLDSNYTGNFIVTSISNDPNSPCGYLNK